MRRISFSAATLVAEVFILCSPLSAAPITVSTVGPSDWEFVGGGTHESTALGVDANRLQIAYGESEVGDMRAGDVIKGISFRLNGDQSNFSGSISTPNYQIMLSKSNNNPNVLNNQPGPPGAYANNRGDDVVIAFEDSLTLTPTGWDATGDKPYDFGPAIEFTNNYTYKGGTLLLEYRHRGFSGAGGGRTVDATGFSSGADTRALVASGYDGFFPDLQNALHHAPIIQFLVETSTLEWDGDAASTGDDDWDAQVTDPGTGGVLGNWTYDAIPGAGISVIFGSRALDDQLNVDLNGNRTVEAVEFDRDGSYVLGSSSSPGIDTLSVESGNINVINGTHTINSNVALLDAGDWDISSGAGLTVAGSISGAFALDKDGDGTLTLTGNNTYTGETHVRAGTMFVTGANERIANSSPLQVHDGATFELDSITETVGSLLDDTGSIVLSGGAILIVGGDNGNGAFSGVISGNGRFEKVGTGSQTLTGENTYTARTRVHAGKLIVAGTDERIADSSPLQVEEGATFEVDGITETIGSISNTTGSIVLSNNAVLRAGADDGQRTYAGVMSGNGSFVKVGTGRQTFTGANTYSGGTTIEDGTLRLGNGGATGSISGAIVNNSILEIDRSGILSDLTLDGVISGTGDILKNGDGALALLGANTFTGDTTINDGKIIVGNSGALTHSTVSIGVDNGLDVSALGIDANIGGLAGSGIFNIGAQTVSVGSNGQDTIFSGGLFGTSDGEFKKEGSGSLELSKAGTFEGSTEISGGSIIIRQQNALQNSTVNLSTHDGLDITINGIGATLGGLSGTGNLNIGAQSLTVGGNGEGTTFEGVISGTGGSLTKTGSGALTLSNASTFSGITNIDGGSIIPTDENALQNSTVSVNVANGLSASGDGLHLKLGGLAGTGNVSVSGDSSNLTVGGNNESTIYSGQITANALSKDGTGVLTLTDDSSHSSFTAINAGTLRLGDGGATGSISGNLINSGTLEIDRSNGIALSFLIFGSGNLVKNGGGTLTLNGANSYSGGTTIDSGTLLADNSTGSATGTGEVFVNSGGTLGGTGSVAGPVTVSGGAIAPGASTGILNLGTSIEFDADSLFAVELAGSGGIAGTDFDLLAVGGSATLSGDLEIDLLGGFMPGELDTFSVLTSNTLSGNFLNVADGGRLDTLAGEGSFIVSYDGVSNSVVLSEFLFSTNGDFDDDGDIDGGDFLLWQRGGSPNPLSANDLAIWESSFGISPLSASSTSVPEPTSLVLLALGGLAAILRRNNY